MSKNTIKSADLEAKISNGFLVDDSDNLVRTEFILDSDTFNKMLLLVQNKESKPSLQVMEIETSKTIWD